MNKKLRFVSILLGCILLGGCSFPFSSDGSFGNSQEEIGDTVSGDGSSDGGTVGGETPDDTCEHADANSDELCDDCGESVVVTVDFYAVNDLHGKFLKNDSQSGIGGMTTYLNEAKTRNPNTVLLSSGDMWQGAWESNLTRGMILNDWMSEMDFVSMTLGNHEFDWGTEYIEQNAAQSDFPYLAINVYERGTNKRVDYCQPSVMVERGGAKIGVIGAIGDCYSSISADKVTDVYFKVGNELTDLVKAEANRLKAAGADCVVYSVHDDHSQYNEILSNGYVDLVFEGHTHQAYVWQDGREVYHIQGGGDNDGISHAAGEIHLIENTLSVKEAHVVYHSQYANKAADPIVATLQAKYEEELAYGLKVLGQNDRVRNSYELRELAAKLYFEAGFERWGKEYEIVLGGGYLSARSPYDLHAGQIIYGDLLNIFPFDNPLVLCKISGAKLKSQFLETNNSNYFVYCGSYGESIRNDIDLNGTYYIVIDTYSSLYAPKGATEIARYDGTTFARDLIAKYIEENGMTSNPTPTPDTDAQTSIPDVYSIGNALEDNATTEQEYYVKGKIKEIHNETWGNLTLEDESGNTLYVYGLYDHQGYRYSEFTEVKPVAGDTVIVKGKIKRYLAEGSTEPLIQIFEGDFVKKTCSAKTYTLTIIPEIYHIGEELSDNAESDQAYYVKGKIISIANDKYGNFTVQDENGYTLYIYGSFDENFVMYGDLEEKPQVGETVVVKGRIKRYVSSSGSVIIELLDVIFIPYE